jgi:adenine phosphoribosyltransferase
MDLKSLVRTIPEFPREGIQFKDITALLKNGQAYRRAIDEISASVLHLEIDLIVSPEARGFIFGAPLAYVLGKGFVPVRKPGKLPGETISVEYQLEYGTDRLVISKDAIQPGQKVLIVDDLLATGGTVKAIADLVRQLGGEVVSAAFLIELSYLNGKEKMNGINVFSLMKY